MGLLYHLTAGPREHHDCYAQKQSHRPAYAVLPFCDLTNPRAPERRKSEHLLRFDLSLSTPLVLELRILLVLCHLEETFGDKEPIPFMITTLNAADEPIHALKVQF